MIGRTSFPGDKIWLWGTVLAAGLVRLAYGLWPRLLRWDEVSHVLAARNLARGLGFGGGSGLPEMHLPPGLPYVAAGLLKLGLPPEWSTAALHVVAGGLLCLPVYGLGRAIFGRRAGLIAAALVAVYPALAAWPYLWSTMTESPFLLCVFAGVWAVRQALHRGGWGWYAATGVSFGLAYLFRPEGLTYFAVLGLFMALWHLRHHTLLRPAILGRLAATIATCLLVISPYVIYLHRVTGHWSLSGKVGLILDIAPAYLAHDQAAHDRAVSRLDSTGQEIMWISPERFNRSLTDYVLADPPRFFFQVRRNMAETWTALFHQDLFSPWIVALAALGMFAAPWGRSRWWDEALLWAALLPLASFWAFFVIDRFLVAALPVGLLWAARGLDHLGGWAVTSARALAPRLGRTSANLMACLPAAATLAFCLWVTPPQLKVGLDRMPWSHREAALWLAANTPADAAIMTRHPEFGLYADRRTVPSPNAALEQMLAYGRLRGATYLLVDRWEVTEDRPHLALLLDPTTAPPELEYLRSFGTDNPTLIYRIR